MKSKDKEEVSFYVALGRLIPEKSAEEVAECGWQLLRMNRLRQSAECRGNSVLSDRYSADLLHKAMDLGARLEYRAQTALPFINQAVIVNDTHEELPIPWT